MLALGVLVLIIGGSDIPLTADSLGVHETVVPAVRLADVSRSVGEPAQRSDCVPVCEDARIPGLGDSIPLKSDFLAPLDTPRTRRRAVQLSDWYGRRLTIHRYVAYATVPVFAIQWAAGDQLYKKSSGAPTWAKTTHRVGATALAAMFTVNTVTGAWNWWDTRSQSQGRVFRTLHALSMLGSDAAFTYAGVKLSNEAETSAAKRQQHRTVALSAMGVTVLSGLAMKLFNR
jgi:hypothetical protein